VARASLAVGMGAFSVHVSVAPRLTEAVPSNPLSIKMVTIRHFFRFVFLLIFSLLKFISFYLLFFTSLFGLVGSAPISGRKEATGRFLLKLFSKTGKIYLNPLFCGV
jgi:hypothetical protein